MTWGYESTEYTWKTWASEIKTPRSRIKIPRPSIRRKPRSKPNRLRLRFVGRNPSIPWSVLLMWRNQVRYDQRIRESIRSQVRVRRRDRQYMEYRKRIGGWR